jgi:hypothetical protein
VLTVGYVCCGSIPQGSLKKLPGLWDKIKHALGVSTHAESKPIPVVLTTGDIIDGLPPGIPDSPDGAPVTVVRRTVGITGIDASRLRWRTWQLLNEANSCYLNYEYYACISVLQTALDSWLIEQFEERGMKPSGNFKRAIEVAKNKAIITEKEAGFMDRLRDLRNTFVHSKEEPWMVPEVNQMTNPPKPVSKEFLNTKGSKDLVALMLSSELAWSYLASVLGMMRERYPTKGGYLYWISQALRHAETKPGNDEGGAGPPK